MFKSVLSEILKKTIIKLSKKDSFLAEALNKKIKQICSCDNELIDHYKNLRHDLSDYKRVHITKSFVLLFKVNKKQNKIYFYKLDHHDNIYR